jgi:hypothetical protein
MTNAEVRKLIDDVFTKEALLIGGLVAHYQPSDGFIWRLFRNLGALRSSLMRRLRKQRISGSLPTRQNLTPHPAIQEFLGELKYSGDIRSRNVAKPKEVRRSRTRHGARVVLRAIRDGRKISWQRVVNRERSNAPHGETNK